LLQVRVRLYCSQQGPVWVYRWSWPVAPAAGGEELMGPVLLDVSLTECAPLYGALLA